MADVLVFEPSEFEVLEIFDFEEEIQKPEETRFFTLDAQLTDFFEKTLPKGKVTKHEIKELKIYKDRLKTAYDSLIVATDSDYVIRTERTSLNIPWVNPVYADFDYKTYSYDKEWRPIFENRRTVNYYPRMIGALPRPYTSTQDGRLLERTDTLVDKDGKKAVVGLGNFVTTKTILRDNWDYDTITVEIVNTADELKTIGFYLHDRPELPRPLMDHSFLKSNKPEFVKTDVSLTDAFPSITAVLEHAIPTTTDPYGTAELLKLYDIKLAQIPWSAWKERFPSVERQDVTAPVMELKFKHEKPDAPGDILTKSYDIPWGPGYDSRLWLSRQIDGGYFVSKILLSEASSAGSLAVSAFSDVPMVSFPETNPEICMNLLTNFDAFLSSGLYRPVKGGGQCIPVSTIIQEKVAVGYKDRTAWKESTKHDILTEHQKLLKLFQRYKEVEDVPKYEKADHVLQSERHKDCLVIQEDPNREPEDKAEALEKIVRDLTLENRKYYDVPGQFVLCSHTIDLLRGGLDDKFKFYAEWTVSVEGKRVCKFCGEAINADTFQAVKEYDEDGHLTMEYSAIETAVVHGDVVNSLSQLKKVFNPDNAGETLLFTILTFLQVLPDELQLMPVLQLIRNLSASLRARAAASKAIAKEKQELVEGALGIAGAVVLLQAHNPFLVPKRSVGNRPLNISGYPRDSDNPEECNTLNSILTLLRKTFEAFPGSYRGGVATILREVLKKSKDLQTQSLQWIKFFYEKFTPNFENARERYEVPEVEAPKNSILLPIEVVEDPNYKPGEELEEEQHMVCKNVKLSSAWSTKRPPNVMQEEIQLLSRIEPGPLFELVEPIDNTIKSESVADKDIRKRVAMGQTFKEFVEFTKIADGAGFVTLTSRILTIVKDLLPIKEQKIFRDHLFRIDISESDPMIRDIAKGYFFELLGLVKASPPMTRSVNEAIQKDLAIRMILLSKDAAEKEDFELQAKERNALKAKLRYSMNDAERELTTRLLELGLGDFLITNVDRERFVRELNFKDPDEALPVDVNRPEEGYNDERDYVENGDQPIADDGTQLEVDRGNYGDRAVRDYDDYTAQNGFEGDDL